MQLMNVTTADWSADLCALAGIQPGHLSPILPSGTIVGPITPEVSRQTGLPVNTVVVNGGHDQACTALGLGIISPGKLLLGCGTAWVITGVTDTPDVAALPPSLDLGFHPAPGHWTVSQSLGGLGASLEWLLQQCWPATGSDASAPRPANTARAVAFASLNAELERTTPGSKGLLLLPLSGGHKPPAADQYGALWGLRLDHTRADMARAMMEGAAYELRCALEPIQQAGMPIDQLSMIGGAAHSPLWPTIVSDVTGLPLSLPEGKQWPAVGAAILAGLGISAFETLAAGLARFQRPARQIDPSPGNMQIYGECFAAYRRLGVGEGSSDVSEGP
jgi:xylulokinase